jgi:prolyl-tRNA synthetase
MRSYSIEAMMGDTRALQAGTSHYFGEKFARAFEIKYLDDKNEQQYCSTTSWGLSTRFVGAIIMVHGDDQGLILPPRLAPHQVVIVPIYKNQDEQADVYQAVERVEQQLKDYRLIVDRREGYTPGHKFNHWELRGVPLRVEIGPKDVANETVAVARRDRPGKAGKQILKEADLEEQIGQLLVDVHDAIYQKAWDFHQQNTFQPSDYNEFKEVVAEGWADVWWCGGRECEAAIKEDTKATNRCVPLDQPGDTGLCIRCGNHAQERALFARAY